VSEFQVHGLEVFFVDFYTVVEIVGGICLFGFGGFFFGCCVWVVFFWLQVVWRSWCV